jgi:glycosyltransferase involved in cell wall biosynthesis
MKILYSHRIQSHDGQGIHVEAIVSALRSEGHDVEVVGPGFYQSGRVGSENSLVSLMRKTLPIWTTELLEVLYSIPSFFKLLSATRRFKPDVIYERYNLFYLSGAWLSRLCNLPFLVEVNSDLANERAKHGELRLKRLAKWCQNYVWRKSNRIFTVTEVLRQDIIARGIEANKILVTPNGINPSDFPETPILDKEEITLGFIGFVREWHGLDKVIYGLADYKTKVTQYEESHPPMRLIVAGDGPAVPALVKLADELGVSDQVSFMGNISREEMPKILANFDIALQPAAVPYASPLKLFEYMASAKAIVAPDQPNIREVIEDGFDGLLFDPSLPSSMWDVICKIASSRDLRIALGKRARMDVLSKFTWTGNAKRIIEETQSLRAR